MLPGKTYRPEDIVNILRRRVWLLLVPFAVISAVTAGVARQLPVTYRSSTVIRVLPQQLPDDYVRPMVNTPMQQRLQSIATQILSRTKLEQLVHEFDLYPEELRTGLMEDAVQRIRNDIRLDVKGNDSFTISYLGRDRYTVRKVTERLGELFMDASVNGRVQLAQETNQFLGSELENARRQLIDQEKKLEAYRTKYSGELPTQVGANLQAVNNTMSAINATVESINAARSRRLLADKSLKDLENGLAVEVPAPKDAPSGASPDAAPAGPAAQTLEAAKRTLAGLRQRYSDEWPEVQRQQRYVNELQRTVDAELLQMPLSAEGPAAPGATLEQLREKRMQLLKADLEGLDKQIAGYEAEEKRLRDVAATYQQRVESVPARESELVELTRDYGTLSTIYNKLLTKSEESKLTARLETRQIGERFEMVDPAQLPGRPFSPDRSLISLFGMIAGLGVGLGLMVLLEYRDMSFKTDEEVTSLLALPVLAVVPLMQAKADQQRARRRRVLVTMGLGSTVAGCLLVLAYTFVR